MVSKLGSWYTQAKDNYKKQDARYQEQLAKTTQTVFEKMKKNKNFQMMANQSDLNTFLEDLDSPNEPSSGKEGPEVKEEVKVEHFTIDEEEDKTE